ncbi:MAG: NAD(P)/FAD-dependent oxidoreductase, partial [Methanomicrobium sp.]|nr:NAD(P)/FAD-dependent oxidoreductase [Methanomicrobium sp.]
MITVIGGGPAGRFAASYLAGAGEKVRIIEKSGNLGGQCLKYGCMVTCGLNDAARNLNQLAKLQKLQVLDTAGDLRVSLPNLWKELGAIQDNIFKVLDNEADLAGIEVITGEVTLSGRDIYLNGSLLPQGEGDKILIATGSSPIIPQVKGIDLKGVYNPHTLQGMTEVPKNLLIIGGGVVAAEYAYIFSQFGSKVTMACRSAFLRDKPERLIKCARKEISGVSIREYTLAEELRSANDPDSGSVSSAVLKSGKNREEIPCDAVIIASGLRPRTDNIKGIALDDSGAIVVDDRYRTNVDGVYAAGDVTGKVFLTPYARMQGIAAAKSIIGEKVPKIPEYIPQSVKLFYEHTFCNMDAESDSKNYVREFSLPAPAGPGSIWSVSERYTGISSIRVDADSG